MYMYICNKLVLIFLGEKLVGANFYAFCNYAPSTQFCNAQNLLNIKAFYECNRMKHITISWICRRINTFYLVCLECTHTHGAVSHMVTQDALFNGLPFKIQWTDFSGSNYDFGIYRWKSYATSSQASLL